MHNSNWLTCLLAAKCWKAIFKLIRQKNHKSRLLIKSILFPNRFPALVFPWDWAGAENLRIQYFACTSVTMRRESHKIKRFRWKSFADIWDMLFFSRREGARVCKRRWWMKTSLVANFPRTSDVILLFSRSHFREQHNKRKVETRKLFYSCFAPFMPEIWFV